MPLTKLTTGSVKNHLIELSLPMTWGIFAIYSFYLVDAYFVGKLGTAHLAAMGFIFPVVNFLQVLTLGVGIGVTSVISRAIGAGQSRQVIQDTSAGLMLAVFLVASFVAIGLLTINPLFRLLGASEEILPLIREYMNIWYYGMVFLVVPMVGNGAIRGTGDTRVPSLIMIVAAGVNGILDPYFILGWGGFPKMGLQGAAIATVLSWILTFFSAIGFLHFRLRLLNFRNLSIPSILDSWIRILRVAVPAAAANILLPLSIGLVTWMMAAHGPEAVAAFGVATRVESFALITIFGVAAGIGPFIGQNWGAGRMKRVVQAQNLAYLFCLFWGLGSALILGTASNQIAAWLHSDPRVIEITAAYLLIVPISYAFQGLMQIAWATFNVIGKAQNSVLLIAFRMFVLYIPLAWLGQTLWGWVGIFFAACLSNLLTGIVSFLWTQKTCRLPSPSRKQAA